MYNFLILQPSISAMRVSISNITKSYGKHIALDKVSAEIPEHAITALLGPNGAGKTTLMKILTGRLLPDSGEYQYEDLNMSDPVEFQRTVSYLPENNPLPDHVYVAEHLKYMASVFQIESPKERIDALASELGLIEVMHRKIGKLSKGTRQRVGLAQALITDPQVLILDEPSNGLDPAQHEELRKLLTKLKTHKTILLSTHLLNEVQDIYDHTVILQEGRCISALPKMTESPAEAEDVVIEITFEQAVPAELYEKLPFRILQADGKHLIVKGKTEDRAKIFNFAVENGLVLLEMQLKQQSLLDKYNEVTLQEKP